MTNREKLFKVLEAMNNKELSENLEFYCGDCPARYYCMEHDGDENTCQNTMHLWLNEEIQADEEFCWCHRDFEEEKQFDCYDYMDCDECPYYSSFAED